MALDPADRRPAYQQIADDLRRWIASEQVQVGDTLPALTELAEQYGRAPQTIRNSISVLADEGLVVIRQGQGSTVLKKPDPTTTGRDDPPADLPPGLVQELLHGQRMIMESLDDLRSRMSVVEALVRDPDRAERPQPGTTAG